MDFVKNLQTLWETSGFANIKPLQLVMILVACFFLFLGIKKKFEPLLLVGIAFGMLLTNLPIGEGATAIYTPELWNNAGGVDYLNVLQTGGLLDIIYIGIKTGIYPCLIFMGIGAMTDFGPLIANPKVIVLGAAPQCGIYIVFVFAVLMGFTGEAAASIGNIAGANGPAAIWLTKEIAPHLLAAIAVAAYSYMALIPLIQPPLMKLLISKKERAIVMKPTREVSQKEKIIFPIMVTIVICMILPSVAPLVGSFMFGNLLKECKVTDRLADTVQNSLMNVVTLFLGISVGATARFDTFLTTETLKIVLLGLAGFILATICGLLAGKALCWATKGKINPLIGAAGVAAVPMAARVVNQEGLKYKPGNYLLMHAMGPNVAGVIGSAVAAGFLMAIFGG